MSYESDECKLLIDEAIHDYLHDDTETEMTVKDWFYDLRKQATKADEYEAKTKAFDEVMDLYVNGSNKYLQTKRHTLDVFIEDVAEILKPFTDEYESGESDAKK